MHVSRKTFYLEVEATDDIFALIDVQYAQVKRFRFQKPRVPTHLICIDKLFVVFFVNIAKNSKNSQVANVANLFWLPKSPTCTHPHLLKIFSAKQNFLQAPTLQGSGWNLLMKSGAIVSRQQSSTNAWNGQGRNVNYNQKVLMNQ